MEKIWKQPREKFTISGDFSENVRGSEHIVATNVDGNTEVIVYDKDDNIVTDTIVVVGSMVIEDKRILCDIFGGDSDLAPYKITFVARTNLNKTWELDVRLYIGEQ